MSAEATLQTDTNSVRLSGQFIPGRQPDLPTMIWLPELVEPAENFARFFNRPDNRISDLRNVWLLNHRNQGGSDHHPSYDMDDLSNDIIRFMDENKITMATIGGHGYGAKVAAATAINNMNRFTGVMMLESGPLDHRYYDAWRELAEYIQFAADLDMRQESAKVLKEIDANITCAKWNKIFRQTLVADGDGLRWSFNVQAMAADTRRKYPETAMWKESYGLWPGQALILFAANSRWVHLSTNTLPMYNVFPRLQDSFPGDINYVATELHGPMTHWIHEEPHDEVKGLSEKMCRWLRWKDGCHVLLADKSEAGNFYIKDRGADASVNGEYTPEHVHHNYLHSDIYEKSRAARGVEGAGHGTFLPRDQFSTRQ